MPQSVSVPTGRPGSICARRAVGEVPELQLCWTLLQDRDWIPVRLSHHFEAHGHREAAADSGAPGMNRHPLFAGQADMPAWQR